jgi:hypothetical protein
LANAGAELALHESSEQSVVSTASADGASKRIAQRSINVDEIITFKTRLPA